jgi:ribosomal protein L11 methyltransferase
MELSISTDCEGAEAVYGLLNRHTGGRTVSEEVVQENGGQATKPPLSLFTVRGYLPLDGREGKLVARIEEDLWHLGQLYPLGGLAVREVVEEEWLSAWRRHYRLQRIGPWVVIAPGWEEYEGQPGEAVVRLEPGLAFGTGLHPTTRMCLMALQEHSQPEMRVLDVGTGSGILALAAARLGAKYVLAVDTDPVAVQVAGENVAANGVENIVEVRLGSAEIALGRGPFGMALVNILAEAVAELTPSIVPLLKPGGLLVGAGIIEAKGRLVRRAFQEQKLALVGRCQEGDWVTLVGRREA